MERYQKKIAELKEKYKDAPSTYQWYLQNRCDIFDDIMSLLELYEQTDEYKSKIDELIKNKQKNFVNAHDLNIGDTDVFEFKNSEYVKKQQAN